MLELFIAPAILMGNKQLPPEATLKKPVELMPQSDSVPDAGHSEAARADKTDIKLGAATISAKATILDNRMMASIR